MALVGSWFWRQRLLVVALLLVIGGAVLGLVGAHESGSFGWFAYAPLGESLFTSDGALVVRRLTLVGVVVFVAGIALLAGVVGYRLGARRRDAARQT